MGTGGWVCIEGCGCSGRGRIGLDGPPIPPVSPPFNLLQQMAVSGEIGRGSFSAASLELSSQMLGR